MKAVDSRSEVKEFLVSRRARITPGSAGLPTYGGNRRVKGLRREEVALLAGVSVDYDVRLESQIPAADRHLDDDVLDAIDRIVAPSVTLNPADDGWVPPALAPTARRR